MTLPLTPNQSKTGPIEVFQDNAHFFVRIHPEDRERAKGIHGRQWDGMRRVWVYPKEPSIYDALAKEFKKDADSFNIQRPKGERISLATMFSEAFGEDDGSENELCENQQVLGGSDQVQDDMYGELNYIRNMLDNLNDMISSQNQVLRSLDEAQNKTAHTLKEIRTTEKKEPETIEVEMLPEWLHMDRPTERALFEKTLLSIAIGASQGRHSFQEWINRYSPLDNPYEFITNTHEKIIQLMEGLVDEADLDSSKDASFRDLVKELKNENRLYCDDFRDASKVFGILNGLNYIRNRFAHFRGVFPPAEKRAETIVYLMSVALVWPKITMDPDDEVE